MTCITFELRERPRHRVDIGLLSPGRLSEMDADKIATLPLHLGNRRLEVGELFQVRGNDASTLIIKNSCDRVDRIGAQMSMVKLAVMPVPACVTEDCTSRARRKIFWAPRHRVNRRACGAV